MNLHVLGTGWVTPVGRDLDTVAGRIRTGEAPTVRSVENPFSDEAHPVYLVHPGDTAESQRERRLRRSSTISHLAVTAAQDALAHAGLPATTSGDRTALLFAATNGGVIYTRRFFAEIADRGTQAGSPLLFPETVYNAPVSHIAAALGVEGTSSTIVGDSTAAFSALEIAADLLAADQCDRAIVIAAEETDWITCEGYSRWRMTSPTRRIVPFTGDGTVFGEGAAALILARESSTPAPILRLAPSRTFRDAADGIVKLHGLIAQLAPDRIVSSANGTKLDVVEATAIQSRFPDLPVIPPKVVLGESFSAASLAQVVHATREPGTSLVTTVGLNHQLAALTVTR
ncbi:MAG: beta-ketoacyl synthase N-terminal-like domain-containing protein [Chthoniobacterales bacterium]